MRLASIATLGLAAAACVAAHAGGPRFVTGYTYAGASPGQAMAFYTAQPMYFTDPGNLAATVAHAQADAMVAAAAATWNVPTAALTLAQGGELAEHVSGANSYFDGSGVVFPADVQATNYLATPIAVIYDTDGSVTDLLLGSGASEPSGCRQTGVTESVDAFGQAGTINHAVIVLNGRCVGSAPQQMLQMQYQLERAFGRVLGLSWSQLNDNVFTGVPTPNGNQAAHWPVMHPIDVICGAYTYQCLPNAFTLRADDLSSLALLYPVTAANQTTGKTLSGTNAASIDERLWFSTQQGMDNLNVTVTRCLFGSAVENFQIVSAITGAEWKQDLGNPVTERTVAAANDVGWLSSSVYESEYHMAAVPLGGPIAWSLDAVSEPINPLYWGEYSLGPYESFPVAPSGSAFNTWGWFPIPLFWFFGVSSTDSAATCGSANDVGTEGSPAAADPSGWWMGNVCGPGHSSWWSASVKAGRSWTLETTALDETGEASAQKLRPVIGVWNATDPTGTLPTVAATPGPLNAMSIGMTQLAVPAATTDATVRIALADLLGQGRPDFAYQARLLYADSVSPAVVGSGGGRITITGTGFRQGNEVTVNGVRASMVSWSSTQIVASAPTMAAAGMSVGVVTDVAVIDLQTAGQTVMSGVLSYSSAVDTIQLVSAPAALETGIAAAPPFAVRVFASDGVTAVAGARVLFAVSSGSASLAACGSASSCVVTTDPTGLAQTVVTGTAAGVVVLTATEMSGGASVSVTVTDADSVRSAAIAGAPRYLAAGAAAAWSVSVTATQDGAAGAGVAVAWSGSSGLSVGSGAGVTDSMGTASVGVSTTGLAAGTQASVTACVWATVCASSVAYGVGPEVWVVGVASGAGQAAAVGTPLAPVVLLVSDGAGHPLQGAPVNVYQRVDAWEGVCPAQGPCPSAPVLASSQSSGTADANGLVSVTPLVVAGQPQVVNVAASSGVNGFVALTLTIAP